MPKSTQARKGKKERHGPLTAQIEAEEAKDEGKLSSVGRREAKQQRREKMRKAQEEEGVLSEALSKKALKLAMEQQQQEKPVLVASRGIQMYGESDSEDERDYALHDDEFVEVEEEDLSEADMRALSLWTLPQKPRTIADLILDKIQEHEAELAAADPDIEKRLDAKVVEVYRGVGKLLSRYKGGRLPKAFKILPNLANWEEILWIAEPDAWTPAACRAATKIFASNLNAKMAQRFFNLVLLPSVRQNIMEFKKLNYHLYMALKKACYKPDAFYKGIVLPLCEERDCTLREATIISSVIAKVSIPALHSAVALMKIASLPYSGANSIFVKVLLMKKYALPYRVIDTMVTHFAAFQNEERELPVLWHQSLLIFAQRYKGDLTKPQKSSLYKLIGAKSHYLISSEIHRELAAAGCRPDAPPKFK